MRERQQSASRIRIDPVACEGVGICAHVAPDLIGLDPWGYPVISPDPQVERADLRQASRAVRACPRRALRRELLDQSSSSSSSSSASPSSSSSPSS